MAVEFAPHSMTGASAPSPFVVTTSSEFAGAEGWRAFNGTTAGWWTATDWTNQWAKLDVGAGNAKICAEYRISSLVGYPTYAPMTFKLYGSNNDSSWDELDSRVDEPNWGNPETRSFVPATKTTAYRYFRLSVASTKGGPNLIIEELYFLEEPVLPSQRLAMFLR